MRVVVSQRVKEISVGGGDAGWSVGGQVRLSWGGYEGGGGERVFGRDSLLGFPCTFSSLSLPLRPPSPYGATISRLSALSYSSRGGNLFSPSSSAVSSPTKKSYAHTIWDNSPLSVRTPPVPALPPESLPEAGGPQPQLLPLLAPKLPGPRHHSHGHIHLWLR